MSILLSTDKTICRFIVLLTKEKSGKTDYYWFFLLLLKSELEPEPTNNVDNHKCEKKLEIIQYSVSPQI
jgi:hypothetical protein